MRLSGQFIFFMKRLIHTNKTLSTYTLKIQGYLYTFCASSWFFKKNNNNNNNNNENENDNKNGNENENKNYKWQWQENSIDIKAIRTVFNFF